MIRLKKKVKKIEKSNLQTAKVKEVVGKYVYNIGTKKDKQSDLARYYLDNNYKTLLSVNVNKRSIKLDKYAVVRKDNFLIFPYRNTDEINTDTLIINGRVLIRPLIKISQDKIFISKLTGLDALGYICIGFLNESYNIFVKDLKDLSIYTK